MRSVHCLECGADLLPFAKGERYCARCLLKLGLAVADTASRDADSSSASFPSEKPRDIPRLETGSEAPLEIGAALGHYRIHDSLGSGGMGHVYVARDTKLHRDVALKVLSGAVSRDSAGLIRFQREARALAALNHPNVVTVYSVEEENGLHFITMELIEGVTLAEVLSKEALSLGRFASLATGLARAVSAAHEQGIVHRDLKPTNVMLSKSGEVKVLDFGLAKPWALGTAELSRGTVTEEGHLLGTLSYMSPEQLGGREVDARSDVFSLGVVLYEMATGVHPFESETTAGVVSATLRDDPLPLRQRCHKLPSHLERIVIRCLEKVPRRRYSSAVALARDLEDLGREIGALGEGVLVGRRAGLGSRRSHWWGAVAATIVTVALAVAGLRFAFFDDISKGQSGQQVMGTSHHDSPSPTLQGQETTTLPGKASQEMEHSEDSKFGSREPEESSREPTVEASVSSLVTKSDSDRPEAVERPTATTAGGTMLPYTVEAGLYRRSGATQERLSTGSRVALGDELFLTFQGSESLYVYVLNEDDVGEVFILFPLQASDLQNPLSPGRTHRLPGSRASRHLNWQVSGTAGEERLLVIASPNRLEALEAVLKDVPQAQDEVVAYSQVPEPVVDRLRGIGGLVETEMVAGTATSERFFSRVLSLVDGPESFRGIWIRRIDLRNPT